MQPAFYALPTASSELVFGLNQFQSVLYNLKINKMKTIFKLLFFVACIGIFAGCEKDELLTDQPDPMLKKAVKVMVKPCTATSVLEKAETDWQNITDALQNSGPGETVQLAAGTFYLHKSIICWDFNGTLKGAGVGKTIIRTAPGMLFDVSDCPQNEWTFELNDGSFMFGFPHHYFEGQRSVSVSDLSIIVDEPTTPVRRLIDSEKEQEYNSLKVITVFYENLDKDRDRPVNLNVFYKNISIKGEEDASYLYNGYSIFTALAAYGYSNGIFEAKNIQVANASGCVKPHAFFGPDAKISVKNCHFMNCYHGVYAFFDHSWTILNNKIEDCVQGLALLKRGPARQNWVGPLGNTYVKDNWVCFEGADAMGIGIQYASNAQVKNNVLEGSSGNYGGIVSLVANNWTIRDNDLCGVSFRPIFLLYSSNFDIRNNYNQNITPVACSDLIIGEGLACED